MRTRSIAAALLLVVLPAAALLGGCSTVAVSTDWDRSVDFTAYRTFRWAPTKESKDMRRSEGSLLDAHIRRAVAAELTAKGFVAADNGAADLLLVYRVSSRNRADVYRASTYRRPFGRVVDVHRYREGTLVLMIVDPRLDQVIWEGVGADALDRDDQGEKIPEIVAKILEEFPPR